MPVGVSPYPTTLDSVLTLIDVKNRSTTTLTVGAGTGDTTINVASTSTFPTSGAITIDDEIIYYTGTTGTTFTGCTRASASTVAATHSIGATVNGHVIASHHSILASTLIAVETKLGYGASNQTPTTTGHVLTVTGTGQTAWQVPPAGAWGSITGTLSSQADLVAALAGKQNSGAYITSLIGDVTTAGAPVGTATIAADAVTFAQMQNISTNKLLGRSDASSGDIQELSIGSNLLLSGGTLSVTGVLSSTARIALVPAAISSGVTAYFSIQIPTDLTMTASTESIGFRSITALRQWATGALTTNRENVFEAPTYRFVGSSTLTNAATLAITGAPIAGTNATITNPYALWVQSGTTNLAGKMQSLDNALDSGLTGNTFRKWAFQMGTSGMAVETTSDPYLNCQVHQRPNGSTTLMDFVFGAYSHGNDTEGTYPAVYALVGVMKDDSTPTSGRDRVALAGLGYAMPGSKNRVWGLYAQAENNSATATTLNEILVSNYTGTTAAAISSGINPTMVGLSIVGASSGAGSNKNSCALQISVQGPANGATSSKFMTGIYVSAGTMDTAATFLDLENLGASFASPFVLPNNSFIKAKSVAAGYTSLIGLNASDEIELPATVHIKTGSAVPLYIENPAASSSSFIQFRVNAAGKSHIGYFDTFGMVFLNAAGSKITLQVPDVASSVNYAKISPSATGNAVKIEPAGDDTNIDLTITPKGSGITNITGVLNATTGFRVNGSATSGNVLRGNGTNFINATLAAADLSNGTSGTGAVALVTTPTFITSIISPAHYGGSANGSTNFIGGTSSGGSASAAHLFLNNYGSTSAAGSVVVGNTSSLASGFRLEVYDSASNVLRLASTGTPGTDSAGIQAGLNNVPTATNQRLGFMAFGASSNSNNSGFSTQNNGALIAGYSSEAWTFGTAQGSHIRFETTLANGATTSRTERWRVEHGGWFIGKELSVNPTTTELAAGDQVAIYVKADRIIFAYNQGGTIKYLSAALDGSTTTWTNSSSAP